VTEQSHTSGIERTRSQSERAGTEVPHPETQPAPQSLKEFLDLVSEDPESASMLRKSYQPDPGKEPAEWQMEDIKIRVVPPRCQLGIT
jgi:hypothetical protein